MAQPYPGNDFGPVTSQPKQTAFRDWHDGLFGCRNDCKSCMYITFCTPCYTCYMYNRYNECSLTGMAVPFSTMLLRSFHRGRERIYGTLFNDCLASIFCYWCTLCQLDRDMKRVESSRGYLDV
ncbi:Cornifelin [Paragonimus heterotremus]|uniref:Cornifelin n=1 Tax=Paragonimus heterotremus TaxID=100268 RepID=A0A8J4T4V1_9TREM|nr:Cornifelin [Paragonimus heterotremus]